MKKKKRYLFGGIEIKNVMLLRSELDKNGLKIVGIQRSLRCKAESLGKLSVDDYISSIVKGDKLEFKLALIDKWCIKSGMAKIEGILCSEQIDGVQIRYIELKKVTINK